MPLPKRKYNESHSKFMNRCVNDETMKKEYKSKAKEKYAECYHLLKLRI